VLFNQRRITDVYAKVNAGNSLVFGFMGLFCVLSPVFVNWIGVKKTLIAGTLGWSVYSAALYQNNRYGTEYVELSLLVLSHQLIT